MTNLTEAGDTGTHKIKMASASGKKCMAPAQALAQDIHLGFVILNHEPIKIMFLKTYRII